MTQVTRNGFVDKNGKKVQLLPAPHEHTLSDVKGLNNALVDLSDSFEALDNNKQNKLTFDKTPTAGSTNPVTSGGLKATLDARANGLIRSLYFVIPSGSTKSPSRLADWVDSTHKVFDYALELPAAGSVTVKAIGGCYAYGGPGYEDTDLGEVNVTKVIASSPSPVAGQRVSWNIYDELIAAGDTAYGSVDYVKDIFICVEISEALQSDKMFVLSVLPYINSEA